MCMSMYLSNIMYLILDILDSMNVSHSQDFCEWVEWELLMKDSFLCSRTYLRILGKLNYRTLWMFVKLYQMQCTTLEQAWQGYQGRMQDRKIIEMSGWILGFTSKCRMQPKWFVWRISQSCKSAEKDVQALQAWGEDKISRDLLLSMWVVRSFL